MFQKCIFFVVPISLSYICTLVHTNKVALSDSFCQYTILATEINKFWQFWQSSAIPKHSDNIESLLLNSWGTYMSAKRIEDANQKCDVLLSSCGATSYTLVQNLVIANPPTQNSPTNLETFIDSLVFL